MTITPDLFDSLQQQALERDIQVWPARSWSPSQLGHPCDRFLVWRFTRWQQQARHDYVLQSIFEQGRGHQPLMYARLEAMGFDIVRESDRPTQYKTRGGVLLSGRPDGRIRGLRGERWDKPQILELKAISGHVWERINKVEDLARASAHYIRGYYAQLQLYLFLDDLPDGLLVLEHKGTGLLKMIQVTLDYQAVETILQRIERLQPLVTGNYDPPPIPWSADVCGRCPFEHVCYPARDFGEGATVLTDTDLIESLDARESLRSAYEDYLAVDKAVKARLKHDGVKHALAGSYVIDAREREMPGYQVEPRTDLVYVIRRVEEPTL